MVLPIRIDHAYIGDLEIWIGWKDDTYIYRSENMGPRRKQCR